MLSVSVAEVVHGQDMHWLANIDTSPNSIVAPQLGASQDRGPTRIRRSLFSFLSPLSALSPLSSLSSLLALLALLPLFSLLSPLSPLSLPLSPLSSLSPLPSFILPPPLSLSPFLPLFNNNDTNNNSTTYICCCMRSFCVVAVFSWIEIVCSQAKALLEKLGIFPRS